MHVFALYASLKTSAKALDGTESAGKLYSFRAFTAIWICRILTHLSLWKAALADAPYSYTVHKKADLPVPIISLKEQVATTHEVP